MENTIFNSPVKKSADIDFTNGKSEGKILL